MINTLIITILVEGCVVLVYCALKKKPAGDLLRASLVVNVLTQAMLWVALQVLYRQYLVTLIVAEVLIWLLESLLIYSLTKRQLTPLAALVLSLCMNVASFGIGWFLPV